VEIQLAISEVSHADGRTDKYGKTNICIFLGTFHCKHARYQYQRGMYLIGQLLSGNLITFWTIVSNITGSYCDKYLLDLIVEYAGPVGRAVKGVVLLPLACWDCGFESRRGYGCECCVATRPSLVLKSPIKCGVPECDQRASQRRPRPTRGCRAMKKIASSPT
jgi:hypothetical protein